MWKILYKYFIKLLKRIEKWMSYHGMYSSNKLINSIYVYFKLIYILYFNIIFSYLINWTGLLVLYFKLHILHFEGIILIPIIIILLCIWLMILHFYKKWLVDYVIKYNIVDIAFLYRIFSINFLIMIFITFLTCVLYLTYWI